MTSTLLALLLRNEVRSTLSRPVVIFWTLAFPVLYLAVLVFAFGRPGSLGSVHIHINDDGTALSQRYAQDLRVFLSGQEAIRAEFPTDAASTAPRPTDVIVEITAAGPQAAGGAGPRVRLSLVSNATRGARAAVAMASAFTDAYAASPTGVRATRVSVVELDSGVVALSYAQYAITGVLVLAMMSAGLMTFAIGLANLRQQNTFKVFACLPMPKSAYFGSLLLSRLLLVLASCIVVLLFGQYILGAQLVANAGQALALLLSILAGSVLFLSMGLLVGSRAKDPSSAAVICNLIYFPMIFLADLTIPIDAFPAVLRSILAWLPASPVVAMVRGVLVGQEPIQVLLGHAAMILAWSAVFLAFTRTSFQSMVAGETAH